MAKKENNDAGEKTTKKDALHKTKSTTARARARQKARARAREARNRRAIAQNKSSEWCLQHWAAMP